MARKRRHVVVTVVHRRVSMFELAVPCEVFGIDRSELLRARGSELVDPWYEHLICAPEPGIIETGQGAGLEVRHGLDALRRADTIVVLPPWGQTEPGPPESLLDALRAAHDRGARIISLCTGAFTLAAAGLLDGRPATTHWMHSAELARLYPKIRLDPRVLYIDDGDIMTSAGTASGIDLCLHLVRLDHGADVANAVARRMVVPPHRDGGQAQYVDTPVAGCSEDDPLRPVLVWMTEHLDQPMTVDELATRARMSPRTFARRFVAVTGTTPRQWLLRQRTVFAQRLLETTDDAVELIASRSGFGSAAALRLHFRRTVDSSPLAYRRTFRSSAA